MKKIMTLLLGVMIMGFTFNVYASEVYYTTSNGIDLTEHEYQYITTFYGDEFLDIMTEEDYQYLLDIDFFNRTIEVAYSGVDNSNLPLSDSHSTPNKGLKIGAACSTNCYINLKATWYNSPSVRSWDVIGAYLVGPGLMQHNNTYVYSTSGTNFYSNIKNTLYALGNSVLLPSSGTNVIVNMNFTTTTGGTIYGSYQHATTPITLAGSKLYNFSLGGYGRVFSFYGAASGVYDGMAGVDISV